MSPTQFADPHLEARARNLQRQLRCLVCQGESIDESRAPLAADLRHLVRQQIAAGKSDQQIQDYLVARYRQLHPDEAAAGKRHLAALAGAVPGLGRGRQRWPG